MAESPDADRFEALAASFVKEHCLPGAAVGVVAGGELVWSAGVGLRNNVRPERLDVPSSLCPIRAIPSACPWPPPLVLERPARPFPADSLGRRQGPQVLQQRCLRACEPGRRQVTYRRRRWWR